MFRICLLEGLRIEVDGVPAAPPKGRPAQGLLAWLALNPGVHSRAAVAARLWPDVLDASARTSLRSALVNVTRALAAAPPGTLVATRQDVGLVPCDGMAVDLAEFQALLRAGALEEALEQGWGELLPLLHDDWVIAERDAHRERIAELLERLAAQADAAGDPGAAVAWSRQVAEREPLSEEAVRGLMTRLAAAGDRAEALLAFERLRNRLADGLGIAPSRTTRELAEAIREERDPGAVGHGGHLPDVLPELDLPPLVAAPRAEFVGRGEELQLLRGAWRATQAGHCRVLALAGHPGIGKTSLAVEFAREVHRAGGRVLFGRCEEETTPYQPFAEALTPLVSDAAHEQLEACARSAADSSSAYSRRSRALTPNRSRARHPMGLREVSDTGSSPRWPRCSPTQRVQLRPS